jgi:HEAT repeat protein
VSTYSSSAVEALDPSSESEGGSILSLLLENIRSANPRVRRLAVREISDYTDAIVIQRMLELADHDPDLDVRCAAIAGLGNYMYVGSVSDYDLDTDQALVCTDDCLTDADFERVYHLLLSIYRDGKRTLDERRYAVESLSCFGNETVEDLIDDLYRRSEKEAKISALLAMGCSGAVRWDAPLRRELSNPDQDVQIEAIRAAGESGLDSLGKDLWRLTYADNKEIVLAAIWSLGQTGWESAFERLDELTLDDDVHIRGCADEAMDEWLFYNGLVQEHEQDGVGTFLDEE